MRFEPVAHVLWTFSWDFSSDRMCLPWAIYEISCAILVRIACVALGYELSHENFVQIACWAHEQWIFSWDISSKFQSHL